jgi:hypothetical protein
VRKTKQIKRQQVRETVAEVSPWDLSGSSESIYKELQDTEKYYLDQYDNVINSGWGWESASYEGDEGHFTFVITRLENDKEYNARVKKLMKIKEGDKIAKEQEKKNEYDEYLRLKKKFEANPYRTNDWSQP